MLARRRLTLLSSSPLCSVARSLVVGRRAAAVCSVRDTTQVAWAVGALDVAEAKAVAKELGGRGCHVTTINALFASFLSVTVPW